MVPNLEKKVKVLVHELELVNSLLEEKYSNKEEKFNQNSKLISLISEIEKLNLALSNEISEKEKYKAKSLTYEKELNLDEIKIEKLLKEVENLSNLLSDNMKKVFFFL